MARRCSTLCLPSSKDDYPRIVDSPAEFRRWIDQAFHDWPELFPKLHFPQLSHTLNLAGMNVK